MSSVAAILPSSTATPFVLGTGASDTEFEPSSISPITIPHYIWHAQIQGKDKFPTKMDCLLDNGAHLVLIRPETIVDLGLHVRRLKEPQCVTVEIHSQ